MIRSTLRVTKRTPLARRGLVVARRESYSTLNFARPVGMRVTRAGLEAGPEQHAAAAAVGHS